jgi:Na+/H+ antiporter NhaD/arsenite permease-like protein
MVWRRRSPFPHRTNQPDALQIDALAARRWNTWPSPCFIGPALYQHLHRRRNALDILAEVARAERDTLLLFFRVALCVGGPELIAYLVLVSQVAYGRTGPTMANVMVGNLSAIVNNIPDMFAVLTMMPEVSQG